MKTVHSFPYRLAAVDIDDTLVGFDKQVSRENAAALAQLRERGVHVLLASGRSHENILTFHQQLHLHGPIISAQGALARHAETDKILYENFLKSADAVQAIAAGQAHDLTIIAYARGRIYADRISAWARIHMQELLHTEEVHFAELTELADEGFYKLIWAGDPDRIAMVAPQASRDFSGRLDTAVTCPHYLEFNSHGTNKATGIAAVASSMKILQHEVLAFGDGNNDVAMLAWAGLGIAMDTGRPAAKKAAKRISPPGDPETALARSIHVLIEHVESARVA